MKETIAQFLKVKDFPFIIKDKNNKEIYHEDLNGYWIKTEYDQNGKLIYIEDSNGYWSKHERDQDGKLIYYENSNGNIIDKRPKIIELSLQEVADKLGLNVKNLRIKD